MILALSIIFSALFTLRVLVHGQLDFAERALAQRLAQVYTCPRGLESGRVRWRRRRRRRQRQTAAATAAAEGVCASWGGGGVGVMAGGLEEFICCACVVMKQCSLQ